MIADIPDLLARRAALSGPAVAIETVATGATLTYAALDGRAARAAALLATRGVGEGDRVAILCRNRPEFFELLFACARLKAILVPLNWRMPAAELAATLADAEPALLVHGAEDRAVAALAGRSLIDLDADYPAARDACAPHRGRAFWAPEDIWYLLYTSGTTGRPKGVIYTYRMALANHVSLSAATGLRTGDATPNFLPLFHTAGINLHSLPALFAGGRLLVLATFDADALVRLFADRRITLFFAVPTVYQALLDHPGFAAAALDHVRHWSCGGAPLPLAVAERCRALGIRLCNGMGMTETGPTAFLAQPDEAWTSPGAIGRPQLLTAVRLVDPDGGDVPDGAVGEVLFAGPGLTPGYWRDEAASRALFTADGWLRSGDLARRDADGIYHAAGRAKDMFVSGGENVYPAEVEAVLAAHPGIAEAAVVGVPDPRWGEVGRAYVLPEAGAALPDTAQLGRWCRERLAGYKVPAAFHAVAEFPRTDAGKIKKRLLDAKALALEGEDFGSL